MTFAGKGARRVEFANTEPIYCRPGCLRGRRKPNYKSTRAENIFVSQLPQPSNSQSTFPRSQNNPYALEYQRPRHTGKGTSRIKRVAHLVARRR